MNRLLFLALMSSVIAAPFARLAAQTQAGGGALQGEVLQANGRIYGTVTSSSTGRPISKMTVRVREVGTTTSGNVLSQKDTGSGGDFDFPNVPLGAYVLECMDGTKIVGTSPVRLSMPSEAVEKKMACTTDVAFWKTKKGGILTGLGAAVAAVGGTAIVTRDDASPSR